MKDKPLYSQIQQYIIEKIDKGEWQNNYQIPPERVLAEQFYVSRITAKNAVLGLVNDGRLYRHRGKGTFVIGAAGSVEVNGSSNKPPSRKVIGFLIPWIEFHYSALLFAGVEYELGKQGYYTLFRRITDQQMESQTIRDFLELPVDGLILIGSRGQALNDDVIRLILDKFPVVLIEKTTQDIKTNVVYCETQKVGALMAEYLAERGVEHMGLITYPEEFTFGVKERIFGFQAALVRKGIQPLPDDRIISVSENIFHENLEASWERIPPQIINFIKDNPQVTGIATIDSLLASYVSMACTLLDRKDMLIIGVDQPTTQSGTVQQTAYIDQQPFEMGKAAANIILNSLNGSEKENKIMYTPRLVDLSSYRD